MGTIHKSQPQFVAGAGVNKLLSVMVIGNDVRFLRDWLFCDMQLRAIEIIYRRLNNVDHKMAWHATRDKLRHR